MKIDAALIEKLEPTELEQALAQYLAPTGQYEAPALVWRMDEGRSSAIDAMDVAAGARGAHVLRLSFEPSGEVRVDGAAPAPLDQALMDLLRAKSQERAPSADRVLFADDVQWASPPASDFLALLAAKELPAHFHRAVMSAPAGSDVALPLIGPARQMLALPRDPSAEADALAAAAPRPIAP